VTALRRADPTARRTVALLLVVGTCMGALLLVAFARYRIPLSDWMLADPGSSAQRVKMVFRVLVALLLAPLLALAAYLWSLGGKVVRPESFHRQAFGSFVILLSSQVREQYLEAVYSKCLRLAAASHVLCWRFCCGGLRCYSAATRPNLHRRRGAKQRGHAQATPFERVRPEDIPSKGRP